MRFSWLRKIFSILVLEAVLIQPILVHAEEDIFQSAVSSTEFATSSSEVVVDTASSTPEIISDRELVSEPTIRVGLYKTSKSIEFKSDYIYEIWSGGQSLGIVNAGQTVELDYAKGLYSFRSSNSEFESKDFIRLVPVSSDSYFTIVNYKRMVQGRRNLNFNVYRDILEYRFSPKSGMPYVINELSLEMYMKGVAEASDAAPAEFLRALAVAARSYANAMISKTLPTDKRLFDVYATTVDQLYLGYNSENSMPNFVNATKSTAGEMVTYNNNPVITYYFTRSNGKTKNGGASRPWLKSVEAKYDKGKTKIGHGLGMSNQDALQRAKKDSWPYKQILGHFYSGTEVEKIY